MLEERESPQTALAVARRAQILDAAAIVFAARGFHAATIKQIARQAEIADGTIYIYFPNKEALLLGLLDRLNETEQRRDDFAAADTQNPRAFFVAYVRKRLDLLWSNMQVVQAILPEVLANAELRTLYLKQVIEPTFALGEAYYSGRMATGEITSHDVPLRVRTVAATVLGLLVLAMLGDTETQSRWHELPEVLAGVLFDGIGP
jgi:AcrR family transcriptional regulator